MPALTGIYANLLVSMLVSEAHMQNVTAGRYLIRR